jgi:hypothetical protein
MDDNLASLAATRRWVERLVIGLDLCPFAGEVLRAGRVRFVESRAADIAQLLHEIVAEVDILDGGEAPADTTLIVIPTLLARFDDFLDAIAAAEALFEQTGQDGRHQLAHFHPDYVFADTDPNDPANLTNRSPLPIIHILRWDDVRNAIATHPNVSDIPRDNQLRMRTLGADGVRAILESE